MSDTGFTKCVWERQEQYSSGAERWKCTICGAQYVGVLAESVYHWVYLNMGDAEAHVPEPKPMDDWVEGVDLSGLS